MYNSIRLDDFRAHNVKGFKDYPIFIVIRGMTPKTIVLPYSKNF